MSASRECKRVLIEALMALVAKSEPPNYPPDHVIDQIRNLIDDLGRDERDGALDPELSTRVAILEAEVTRLRGDLSASHMVKGL